MRIRQNPIICFFVLIMTLLAFLPALKGEFLLWDDDTHVLDNSHVRSLSPDSLQAMFTSRVNDIYIPLTTLVFALEYHFAQFNPVVFHAVNLVLHLVVCVLVFWLALRLKLSSVGACVATLIFAVHPMRVESVVWITELKDVLYAFFYLAALHAYLNYLGVPFQDKKLKPKPVRGWYILTVLLGTLSVLAKPMAVSLPLILLLLDWFVERDNTRRYFLEKVWVALPVWGITLGTYLAHARLPADINVLGGLIWIWSFVFYWTQFFMPTYNVPVYELPRPVDLGNYQYYVAVLAFVLLLYSFWRFRRNKWYLFAAGYFFFSIFFLLRFDMGYDTHMVADRFMYLPGLGFCLLLGKWMEGLWYKPRFRAIALVLSVMVVGFLSARTFQLSRIWQTSATLWDHELKYYPTQYVALVNKANVLLEQADYQEALRSGRDIFTRQAKGELSELNLEERQVLEKIYHLRHLYRTAINSHPESSDDAKFNLAHLHRQVGQYRLAMDLCKDIIASSPAYEDAYFSLAELYLLEHRVQEAVDVYQRILSLWKEEERFYVAVVLALGEQQHLSDKHKQIVQAARRKVLEDYLAMINAQPIQTASYKNLGLIYLSVGEHNRAVSALQAVLDKRPNDMDAMMYLGQVYRQQGRYKDALETFKQVYRMHPQQIEALFQQGIIHFQMNDLAQAQKVFLEVVRLQPDHGRAYFNLGYIAERTSALKDALEWYEQAVNHDPQNPEAYYNLGNVYAVLQIRSKARSYYRQALDVHPGHMDAAANLSTICYMDGDFTEALQYLDQAVKLGYQPPDEYLKVLAPYR
jgi:tetratricopeptide (TPR) repeat protein